MIAAHTKTLPNIGDPRSTRRSVLKRVIHCLILYPPPVWHEVKVISFERNALLRIANGYGAVQVITGIHTITLLTRKIFRLYHKDDAHLGKENKKERKDNRTGTAASIKRLILNSIPWVNVIHRNSDYYLTQFLSEHAFFK